ncbi:MAG: glycoside hydrolase family 9 protein, partial [Fibrobacter sp.]|nr:glycoside hydrolase family 9 protein [Fibrobacter sp.]
MSLKIKIPFLVVLAALCINAQELLKNNDFAGGLAEWGSPSVPQGTVTAVKTQWGGGLSFDVQNGGTNSWDIQMTQGGINLRPGYTYKISVRAHANSGSRKILVGIGESGGEYLSYIEFECSLESDLGEFVSSWENSNTSNSNARFFVNGGGENVGFTLVSLSVWESKTPGGDPSDEFVLVNQVGYYAKGPKIAAVRNGKDETYKIMKDGSEVWSGKPGSPLEYTPSKETLRILDFSDFQQEGTFTFTRDGNAVSRVFTIAKSPAQEISKAALRAYYYQRASTEITEKCGGIWNRPLGHPDNVVHRHSSTGESGTFASEKGWYDAGDYGKYIVNSGISTYTLLMLYGHFPQFMDKTGLNIPESSNDLPDLLDEAKWNIDWMLTMQSDDGGVYHKLTTLQFETDKIMPNECTSERYVYMKTTSASLNFAAVMEKASV